jgi:hypothetical protein
MSLHCRGIITSFNGAADSFGMVNFSFPMGGGDFGGGGFGPVGGGLGTFLDIVRRKKFCVYVGSDRTSSD